jgi:ankyrin repeat protein
MGRLYAAARRGDIAQVSALIDRGADPNEAGDEHGTTAMTTASFLGHVEVVRLLLERGADIDRPNKFGARPLFSAANNAKLRVIQVLLKAGASLSVESDDGLTAFMHAATSTPETVRMFLKHGVDVNAVSSKGYTALQCAAINDLHGPAIIPLLLEAGADPAYRDGQGRTAKDLALERGRKKNAAVLDAHMPSLRSDHSPTEGT